MAAWRSGSISRTLLASARSSSLRSSPPLPRLRPPPFAAPRPSRRRLSFAQPRYLSRSRIGTAVIAIMSRNKYSRYRNCLTTKAGEDQ